MWIQSLHWTTFISRLDELHLWLEKKLFLSPEPSWPITCHSTTSNGSSVCLCLFVCMCVHNLFQTSPVPLLPGLWKANEESWAEGSFCVLVKKNNLCQRKVLQHLCCRTCSQKGWRDVLTEHKGSVGWRGHVGAQRAPPPSKHPLPYPLIHSHIIYKRICAS